MQPRFVLHHLARADAKHHVVRLVIASAQEMHVVRCDHSDPKISRNLHQRSVTHLLLFHAVVVQFHEEIFRTKNVAIFGGALFCFLDVVCLNGAVDFARKTTAQSDQTSRAFCEQRLIDPRGVVETVQMRCGHQLHEIAVADFVFG